MIHCQLNKQLRGASGIFELNIDAQFPARTFTILFGESGAGKTSILRMLAGLMTPEHGLITSQNQVWFDSSKKIYLKPQLRKGAFVFQDQGLFPNMTVRKNLEFAQRQSNQKKLIDEIIELFELGDLQHLSPINLSGGQKQKVALARSIINQPNILLLDEPLSALDRRTRLMLQEYIQKAHKEFKLTTIMVSHDLSEIHKITDRVLKLEEGVISEVTVETAFGETNKLIKGSIISSKAIGENIKLEILVSREAYEMLEKRSKDDDEIRLCK
ncbi:MAG: ATP-binding cassette domain-containing protein [Saprospiraceae bacterium]|nr:ATP-binding cassette domain-containing protein [Saprospiraceae bacterium]